MSLTFGAGPLSKTHGPTSFDVPERAAFAHPWGRRLRAVFGGTTVFDTERAMTLHETGKMPAYWVPRDDVRDDLLRATGTDPDHATTWDVVVGNRVAAKAVTSRRAGSRSCAHNSGWLGKPIHTAL